MEPKLPKLLQIGIIVRSVDKAIENYEKMLGIGPWEIRDVSGEEPPFDDLVVNGKPCRKKLCKLAFCRVYGMEFELIEPICESPYSKWLEEHGPGIQHIAVVTEDSYDTILDTYQKEKGEGPWIRATGIGGMMDYSYLDFREEMGLIMECYRHLEPGKVGIPFDYKGVPAEEGQPELF